MMSFSYRAKLSKKLNKCTYRPIWSEFCADPYKRLLGEYIELEKMVTNNLMHQFDLIDKKLNGVMRELQSNLDKVKP